MILKEIPKFERPREKALQEGIDSLSNIELLAIILRTGSKEKNVLQTAQEVLYQMSSLSDFDEITVEELTKIKGIGRDKAVSILASMEFGKRIIQRKNNKITFKTPDDIVEFFKPLVINLKQEHLYAIYLNVKGEMIAYKLITKGTINTTLVDATSIFKWAYKYSSSALILVHNHPSGNPSPSLADAKMTEELIKQSKVINILILDHIIIGDTYYSMKKDGKYFKPF